MPRIYVDADACPVKQEIFRVAERHGLPVTLVANAWMRILPHPWLDLVVVNDHFDAADDWIVENLKAGDIVVTADIPLASRCLEGGAFVLGIKGRPFEEANIGTALANREFLSQMRDHGVMGGGPTPFSARDRSKFLQALDQIARTALNAAG